MKAMYWEIDFSLLRGVGPTDPLDHLTGEVIIAGKSHQLDLWDANAADYFEQRHDAMEVFGLLFENVITVEHDGRDYTVFLSPNHY